MSEKEPCNFCERGEIDFLEIHSTQMCEKNLFLKEIDNKETIRKLKKISNLAKEIEESNDIKDIKEFAKTILMLSTASIYEIEDNFKQVLCEKRK